MPRPACFGNVRRAQYWLEAAARGELVSTGDRFELPDFSCSRKGSPDTHRGSDQPRLLVEG